MQKSKLKEALALAGQLSTEAMPRAVTLMRGITDLEPNKRLKAILREIKSLDEPVLYAGIPAGNYPPYPRGVDPWKVDLDECEAYLVTAIRRCGPDDLFFVAAQLRHLLERSVFDRQGERDIREQASKGLVFAARA